MPQIGSQPAWFARYVLMIAAFSAVTIFSFELALRSPSLLDWLDRYRPAYIRADGSVDMREHVEAQMLHVERLSRSNGPRIAVVGSSSVVNGIDETIVNQALAQRGISMPAQNLGMTALLANELSVLSPQFLTPDTMALVYLYNGFSFGDVANPDAGDVRGHSFSGVTATLSWRNPSLAFSLAKRYMEDSMWSRRFRNLLASYAERALRGDLSPLPHPFDYALNRPPAAPEYRTRIAKTPVPTTNWIRKAYVESSERPITGGYTALSQFCQRATADAITVIISPAPEAIFGRTEPYAVGVDFPAIDRRVEAIARDCGAHFIPRDTEFENRDELFIDDVHLGRNGRDLYSKVIAEKVAEALLP